jgi:hypothetical protein
MKVSGPDDRPDDHSSTVTLALKIASRSDKSGRGID